MLDAIDVGGCNHSICISAWVAVCVSTFQEIFLSALVLLCMAVILLHQNFCFL